MQEVAARDSLTPVLLALEVPSYYRARYYDPNPGRFLSEDPIDFRGGINFYSFVRNEPLDFPDPFGLKDYNQEETLQWLREAYGSATSGRIQGLRNIYNNSRGRWDFQYVPEHQDDTWTWCGRKMDAAQFGNFIAGFQGAAYDHYYFWTTGTIWAQAAVEFYGVKYHITGASKAKHDPFDRTGRPDIRAGEHVGWNFAENKGTCGCGGGGGW